MWLAMLLAESEINSAMTGGLIFCFIVTLLLLFFILMRKDKHTEKALQVAEESVRNVKLLATEAMAMKAAQGIYPQVGAQLLQHSKLTNLAPRVPAEQPPVAAVEESLKITKGIEPS